MIWIGIDPGKDTGVVVRSGDRLLWWDVIEGDTPQGCEVVTTGTLARVIDSLISDAILRIPHDEPFGVVIEGLTKPKGRKGGQLAFINPLDLAAPAMVIGHIRATYPDALMIPPNKHGSRPLSTYPDELITPAERRHGLNRPAPQNSTTRHARSAWDCAGAATQALRLQVARAGVR